jgi:hypothetical protein
MLTGNLVLVQTSKHRVQPRYIDRDAPHWLETAESLLLIFRGGVGQTRGEIQDDVAALTGEGGGFSVLVARGLAKVLEDRAQFEVVADAVPERVRERVFSAAASQRAASRGAEPRAPFRREAVLQSVASELAMSPDQIDAALFADLKDENQMIAFRDLSAQALLDRYNIALAQAVVLRAVSVRAELRGEPPARYRDLFRMLKFHRLLWRVEGTSTAGYRLSIDGPLSLFTSTTRYGLQLAMFLPVLLAFREFRVEAELRWGPRRVPASFFVDARERLVSAHRPRAQYVPAEINGFLERFRQIAPDWHVNEADVVVELGNEGVWVPDFRFEHRATGVAVFVDVVGFWNRASLERLDRQLPIHGAERYILAVSDRLKVDEADAAALPGPILRYKDIPNASELRTMLERFVPPPSTTL